MNPENHESKTKRTQVAVPAILRVHSHPFVVQS
jgi:hypothetical protein